MPKKRKNGGKNRHNRGRVGFVRCDVSGRAVPKDKAIKRFIVRNLVDASGTKDIQDKTYYNKMLIPKMYYKAYYCVSAAIHQRIVRPRNRQERKNRNPPPEVLKRWAMQARRQREQEMDRMDNRQSRNLRGRGRGRGGRGRGGYGRGGPGMGDRYGTRGGYGGRGGGRGGYGNRDGNQRYGGDRDRGNDPRRNFRGGMRGGARSGVRGGMGGGHGRSAGRR